MLYQLKLSMPALTLLRKALQEQLSRNNPARQNRVFEVGGKVLIKSNRRLGKKNTPLYVENVVKADVETTVLVKGRVVHTDNIRQSSCFRESIQLFNTFKDFPSGVK